MDRSFLSGKERFRNIRGGSNLEQQSVLGTAERFRNSQAKFWTFNAGGLTGVWRLIHHLESVNRELWPHVVAIQEVCCNVNEWKSTRNRWDKLGFMVYADDNVIKGSKRNGVITVVTRQLNSKPIDGFSSSQGYAALATEIQDILFVNSYCPPRDIELHSHAAEFEEMIIRTAWQGSALWCGDWNQQPDEGWIATLGHMLDIAPVSTNEVSSRWKGSRLIVTFYQMFHV